MPTAPIAFGTVRIKNFPEDTCFTSFQEFLKALQDFLIVEIPASVTNVIVSNQEPSTAQRGSVWFKFNNAGVFQGIYLFTNGAWNQMLPAPNEVIWMYGSSDDIPEGFQLIDSDNPNFTAPQITHIQTFFYPTPGTPPYEYFAVTFTG